MKSHLLFFLFGVLLGAAVFWLPTLTLGGGNFILPALFPFGSWAFLAVPYLLLFAAIFAVVALIYRLCKIKLAISARDGAWILLGLYLSLTLFFFLAAGVMAKGDLML